MTGDDSGHGRREPSATCRPSRRAGSPWTSARTSSRSAPFSTRWRPGKRAFQGRRAVDTLAAILNEEPEPIAEINPQAPGRCAGSWSAVSPRSRATATPPRETSRAISKTLAGSFLGNQRRFQPSIDHPGSPPLDPGTALALLAVGTLAAGMAVGRREGRREPPSFQPFDLSRRRGQRRAFAPDGQTILYSALWGKVPSSSFCTRRGPRSRSAWAHGACKRSLAWTRSPCC